MSQFPPESPPPAPPPPPPPGGGMPVGGGSQPAEPGAAFSYGWKKFQEHWQAVLVALIIGFVIIVVLGVIGYLIQSALTSTDASKVMSTDRLGSYILGAIIVGILTFVGFILCILPGIAVGIFVLFWGYFLVDKGMSPIEAITASLNLVKDNLGPVFIFWLLTILITIAGAIVCGVGLIVAVPVVVIATGYMYKRLQGEPVAA